MSQLPLFPARVFLLAAGMISPLPHLVAQSRNSTQLAARLDEYLLRAEPFGFTGIVLVSVDGETVLQKGYGRVGSRALEAGMALPIASLSKQFTATAILRLEMRGELSTDDEISNHLAGVPEDKQRITIHQLLTHTSGIVGELPDDGTHPARDDVVRRILAHRLEFGPGTDRMYSNCGYTLLATIVEETSGTGFAEFLSEEFFAPIGMQSTSFWAYGDAIVPRRETSPPSWLIMGAGGIASTVGDLHSWLEVLGGEDILSAQAKRKLYTPTAGDYAYGWRVADSRVFGKVIWHDGDRSGVSTTIRRYEDQGVTLIYFDTAGLKDSIMNKILLIPLGREVSSPPVVDARITPADISDHEGTYDVPDHGEIVVRAEGRRLWIGARGQEIIDALASASGTERDRARAANASTLRIVSDLARGRFRSVGEAFTDRIPDEAVEQAVRADWKLFEGTHGPFASVEILGTCASNRSTLLTYARLRFEAGMEVYRFEWDDGEVMGINETAKLPRGLESYPGDREYLPQAAGHYVSFDFRSERSSRVVFRRTGTESTVIIERPDEAPIVGARR